MVVLEHRSQLKISLVILPACGQLKPPDLVVSSGLAPESHLLPALGSFAVNLGQGADELALHFNPRFNESTIVCNSRDSGNWGREQRDNHMCFGQGAEVKVRSQGRHRAAP